MKKKILSTVFCSVAILSGFSCKHAGTSPRSSEGSDFASVSSRSDEPSKDSCVFYLHQEIDRQCLNRAGDSSNYLTHFGYNYCNKFLYNNLAQRSKEMAYFLVNVRYCLQDKLARLNSNLNCVAMEKAAIASHYGCYLEAKFCALSINEQVAVAREIVGFDILPTFAEAAELFMKIEKTCFSNGLSVVALSLDEIGRRSKALSQDDLKKVDEIFARAPKEESRIVTFFSNFLASLGVQFDPDRRGEPGQLGLTDQGTRVSDEEFRQGLDQFYRQL